MKKILIISILLIVFNSCYLKSLKHWFTHNTQIHADDALVGEWVFISINNFTNKLNITIDKPSNTNRKSSYSIRYNFMKFNKIPLETIYRGTVHEINNKKYIQLRITLGYDNYYYSQVGRTHVITIARFEYDKNNIILWSPNFMQLISGTNSITNIPFKCITDYHQKKIIVDDTKKLENYVIQWHKNNVENNRGVISINITRKETKFHHPKSYLNLFKYMKQIKN